MRTDRHALITRIITSEAVHTQQELRERLKEQGCDVTQATLSRDIAKMGLIKKDRYVLPDINADNVPPILPVSITSCDYAGNTVVVKCAPGTANAVCVEIDKLEFGNVVGTLAGDDTIFILARTERDAKELMNIFKNI